MTLVIAVLASGKATDLYAVDNAIREGRLLARIACLISNKPDAPCLERARSLGIEALLVRQEGKAREDYDREVAALLDERGVQLVVLIGFMRILSDWFVDRYKNRIINVHPSLLPEFGGLMDLDVHRAVLATGTKETGATIHFVTNELDGGPLIMQKTIPVSETDTPETLKAKVQAVEQDLLPKVIALIEQGRVKIVEGKVVIKEG
jgi:phosphoribosylglycinamide formyltransferase-1